MRHFIEPKHYKQSPKFRSRHLPGFYHKSGYHQSSAGGNESKNKVLNPSVDYLQFQARIVGCLQAHECGSESSICGCVDCDVRM
jgi:hypothetical protein